MSASSSNPQDGLSLADLFSRGLASASKAYNMSSLEEETQVSDCVPIIVASVENLMLSDPPTKLSTRHQECNKANTDPVPLQ